MHPLIETHPLISVRSSATVDEAARLMADCGMGAVGVLDSDRKFQGIFTERDLTHLVGLARNPSDVKLAEVVNDFPVVVDGPVSLAQAADRMETSRIRHLIVREGDDYRIVSMRDLFGARPSVLDEPSNGSIGARIGGLDHLASFAGPFPMKAEGIMSAPPIAVRADSRLEEAAEILSDRCISGMPVVDTEDQVIGVISGRDIARLFGNSLVRLAVRPGGPRPRSEQPQIEQRSVAEAMSAPAVTASRDTPVTTLAEIMFKEEINRLPIVNGNRLVGIVTRSDVLRAFAGLPHQAEREVAEPVVMGGTWQMPW